jgi:two-component system phosphate regulon response regulator OmpR
MEAAMADEPPHVLVVDDDTRLRQLLRKFLVENGFVVTTAADAAEARAQMAGFVFDLLVLDVMMPGDSGLDLARDLRRGEAGGAAHLPILMLTARDEVEDRISGLEHGADDYLTKPFEARELVLRIRSILRRVRLGPPAPAVVAAAAEVPLGDCVFDIGRQELRCRGERIHLTTTETQLLGALAGRPGALLTREDLAEATGQAGANSRTIDVQVTRLRKKIEPDPRQPLYLQTVRGQGYILRPGA